MDVHPLKHCTVHYSCVVAMILWPQMPNVLKLIGNQNRFTLLFIVCGVGGGEVDGMGGGL